MKVMLGFNEYPENQKNVTVQGDVLYKISH